MIIDFPDNDPIDFELDQAILDIGELIDEEEQKIAIIVPEKYDDIRRAYAIIKYLTKNMKAKLSYAFNEPYKSMGSISVEAESLVFDNSELFSIAARFANNVDIYPLTNGKIRMDFTFHGITRPIE